MSVRVVGELLVDVIAGAGLAAIACQAASDLVGQAGREALDAAVVDYRLLVAGERSVGVAVSALAGLGVSVLAFGGPAVPEAAYRIVHGGGSGYVSADATLDELKVALAVIGAGGRYIDPAVSMREQSREPRPRELVARRITVRELAVLRLVATGAITEDIARELAISPSTVKARLRSACTKLGVKNRAAAVALLSEQSLL